jgi:MFS transporter, DHA3 family, macrolide efflux protein
MGRRRDEGRNMTAGSPFSVRVGAFLLAEALSGVGSWATLVAIWGFAAYEYGATAGEVSLFGLAFTVPGVVLSPLAGAVVDRLGPKVTLAMAKVIGAGASLALLGADDFRSLTIISAFHGVAMAFTYPALGALPPRLVDERHLARTNALVSLADEAALIFGPVVAGVSIALVGFQGAFVFDAFTYAFGLVVLPLVRLRPVPAGEGENGDDESPVGGPGARVRELLEGWRLVVRRPVLGRVVACTFSVHLLYGAALLAEPLYVRDTLQRPTEVFAALQTVFGIFLVAGGVLAARAGERIASFRWVALGVGLSGITAIIYLGTPFVLVAFLGVALWGVVTAVISGPSRTVLQRSSPPSAHGRVMAADLLAANAAMLSGVALAGVLVGAFGVPWSITALGLGVAAVATLLAAADRRDTAEASVDPPRPDVAVMS